jgi:Ni,Fe-hydrogenase I cytochrome b subunit
MKLTRIIKQQKVRSLVINFSFIFIWCLLWDVVLGGVENSSSQNVILKRIGQALIIGIVVTIANTYQRLKEEEINK